MRVDVENRDGLPLEPRVPWLPREISSGSSHTGVHHRYYPELTNDELRRVGPIGRMAYAVGAVARELSSGYTTDQFSNLGLAAQLMPDLGLLSPRTCILDCYDWTRRRPHQLHLTWRFGVAFAVDSTLFQDSTSGILGLGLTG